MALYCALKGGHATTAKFLIDKGSDSLLSNDPNLSEFYEADLLQYSARKGLTAVIKLLLSKGLSADAIHRKSDFLLTPLEEAACTGQCDVVSFLLDQGADIDGNVPSRAERLREMQMESDSWEDIHYWGNISPLYAALHAGQGEVAKILIERGANASNINSDEFQTLIDLAAKYGLFDVLKLLNNNTLDDLKDFHLRDGETILTSAVIRMDFALVSRLLQNGIDVNTRDEDGNSALHKVFWQYKEYSDPHKTMEMFNLLVSFGADINARNKKFKTPLHDAVELGAEKIISLLLELDCKMNFEDTERGSPLLQAVIKGDCKLVEALLQCGADVNQGCCRDERTLLHAAVGSLYSLAQAHVLLEYGADLEAEDVFGETPLAKAVEKDGGMAELLLNRGGTVHTMDKFGKTLLMKAVERGKVLIVRTLLEHGASVNATDEHGRSPLHYIVHSAEICKLLLDNGSDVNIADDNGETPLHQAIYDPDIVKMLLDHGAKLGALDRENRTPLHAASY